MSDGAFALFIDQSAGQGGGREGRRVIPIPRADEVRLSLAFDDFGGPPAANTATARVRIIDNNGNVRDDRTVTIRRGRSTFITLQSDDRAVSVHTFPIAGPPETLAAVTALVEFET
ncbi:MAG: hypothetical protein ACRDYA_08475 [Egibacteraceae bacterium]